MNIFRHWINPLNFFLYSGLAEGDGGGDGVTGGTQSTVGDPPANDPNALPVVPQWAANFPGELTGDEASRTFLGRFKGDGQKVEVPVELVKSAVEAQRTMGGMVKIPAENAKPDEVAAFNKKLGVPDTDAGYEFKVPENSPEGLFKDDQINAFKKDAHELGIPKAKAEKLFDRFAGRQIELYNGMMQTSQTDLDAKVKALKTDLGAEFDATVQVADKAVYWSNEEMFNLFKEKGLLAHPAIVKGFAKIGKALGEGTLKGVDTGGAPPQTYTKQELEQMIRDPKYKLPQGDPVGDAWRAKVTAGYQALYPGTSGGTAPSSGHTLHGV